MDQKYTNNTVLILQKLGWESWMLTQKTAEPKCNKGNFTPPPPLPH